MLGRASRAGEVRPGDLNDLAGRPGLQARQRSGAAGRSTACPAVACGQAPCSLTWVFGSQGSRRAEQAYLDLNFRLKNLREDFGYWGP